MRQCNKWCKGSKNSTGQRSKRHYQKKRERKCDDDSDVSSVVSLPSKRHHTDDVSIPYEDVREAVYTALEEKENEKQAKHGDGGGGDSNGGCRTGGHMQSPLR